jgi:hypothetical protein
MIRFGNSAKFRIILMLISFLFVGLMLWKLHQANNPAPRAASEQRSFKVRGSGI